jgi:DNA-directed RNA polymerase
VKITQSYLHSKQVILKPFSFSKTSITLRVKDKTKLNKMKQGIALMPNLIHSLDATSLALLFKRYHNKGGSNNSIYTIHDCFAVTANNVASLIETLKDVYIEIYTDRSYLETFDKNIRECIKMHYKDVVFEGNIVTINDTNYEYPSIDLVTTKKLYSPKDIIQSSYLIS